MSRMISIEGVSIYLVIGEKREGLKPNKEIKFFEVLLMEPYDKV